MFYYHVLYGTVPSVFRYLKWKAWDKLDNTPSDFGRSGLETNPNVEEHRRWSPRDEYPLVNIQKTMEHHHFSKGYQQFLWSFFNSYVKLPEGKSIYNSKNYRISGGCIYSWTNLVLLETHFDWNHLVRGQTSTGSAPQCFDIFGHTPKLMIFSIILPLKIAEHSGCTTHSQAPNIIFRLRSPKNIFHPQLDLSFKVTIKTTWIPLPRH